MAQERLQVILELISGQYKREAKQAAGATGGMTKEMGKADSATGKFRGGLNKMNGVLKGLAIASAGAAIAAFAKDSIRAASDLEESFNAVGKTFGDAAGQIEAFGLVSAQAAGLSTSEFQQMAAQTGQLLRGMGLSADEAAAKTIQLTQRAADMASVMNTSVEDALLAVGSALRGETEPIRRYIGSFSVAEVEAYAMAEGMLAAGEEMDSTTKAAAAMGLILDRTANQAGDFVQTSEDLANATRVAGAEWENAKASFGEAGLPVATFFVQGAADALLNLRSKFDDAAYGAVLMRDAVRYVNDVVADGGDRFHALASGLAFIAEEGDLTADQFTALAAAAGYSEDQFAEFRDEMLRQAEALGYSEEVMRELESAMNDGGAAADEAADEWSTLGGEMNQIPDAAYGAADGIKEVGDEARTATPSVKDLAEATRDVYDALLAAADPAFAAADAVSSYLDAIADREALQEDGEATARDLAEADLAVAEAALEASAAVAEFGAGNKEAAIQAIADALDTSYQEAEDLLEIMGVLNDQDIVVPVSISMNSADRALLNSAASSGGRTTDTRGSGDNRARGGPVSAGQMYQMGESNRPELMVIPGDNGRVFSNSDMKALIGAFQSGGGTSSSGEQHFHFHSTGDITGDVGTASLVAGISRRVEVARR
jgi:hypothetical protein